ncbi:hypothetical protein J1614_001368 [Plenodomus biglobosus]|nr:hypothetical protein J1614_001368 [Plenodomus biglobosus]
MAIVLAEFWLFVLNHLGPVNETGYKNFNCPAFASSQRLISPAFNHVRCCPEVLQAPDSLSPDLRALISDLDMPRHPRFGPPDIDPGEAAVKDLVDYGFEHLHLPSLRRVAKNEIFPPPDFQRLTPAEERMYLNLIYRKLTMAKTFFEAERHLGFDYDRPSMYKEATPRALAEGPIKLSLLTQAHIKLLLDEDQYLRDLWNGKLEEDAEVTEAMRQYLLTWKDIRQILVLQTPGNTSEERTQNIQAVMKAAFGDIADESDSA